MNDYRAFISYRHLPLDRAVAIRLHRMLERYTVPAPYREHPKERRLGRIFRDEDELKLTSDLSAAICDTLDRTQYLIVLCSPRTKESPWVMQEIDYFLAHHSRDRILTVLLEGTVAQSVPPQLLEADSDGHSIEPLAANVVASSHRQIFSRLRSEFLRIAAAILGCSYDALRQRKKQYAMKRMLVILSAVFAAAVLFMFILMDRNNQIQQQYEQAQFNESQMLALLSGQSLAQQDRIQAIRYALTALGDEAHSRPYVPEAEQALANALYAYEDPTVRPRIRLSQPMSIEQIAGSKTFITLDWAGMVRGFSGKDGNQLWQKLISPSIQTFLYIPQQECAVFVDDTPCITVLHEQDGMTRWSAAPDAYLIAGTAVSPDGNMIALAYEDKENLDTCIVDIRRISDGKQLCLTSFSLDGADTSEMNVRFSKERSALAIQTFFYEDGTSRYTVIDLKNTSILASIDSPDEGFLLENIALENENCFFDQTDFSAAVPEKQENVYVVYETLGDSTNGSVLDRLSDELTACYPLPASEQILEIIRSNYQAECRIAGGTDAEDSFTVRLSGRHATTEIAGVTSDGRYVVVGEEMIDLTEKTVVPLMDKKTKPAFFAHHAEPGTALRSAALTNGEMREGMQQPIIRRWTDGREQESLSCPYSCAPYDEYDSVLLETSSTGTVVISLHSNTATKDMERIAFYREDANTWTSLPYFCKQEEMPRIALAQTSPLCAFVTYDGELMLYDAEKNEYLWNRKVETGFAGYLIEDIRFCAEDRFLFVYAHNQVMLYDLETGECVTTYSGFSGKNTAPWPRIAFSLTHEKTEDSLFIGAYECMNESRESPLIHGLRIDLNTGIIRTVIKGLCFYDPADHSIIRCGTDNAQPVVMRYPCYTTQDLITQGKALLE